MIARRDMWMLRLGAVLSMVVLASAGVAACGGSASDAPPGTVGEVAPPSTPDTVLPLATGTSVFVDETQPVPEGALFGGEVCGALTNAELQGVAGLVPRRGTDPAPEDDEVVTGATDGLTGDDGPVIAVAVSGDACRYEVQTPLRYSVLVRVRDVFALKSPDVTDPSGGTLPVDALSGIGDEAIGIDRGSTYEVVVRVAAGWFSVNAPDRDVAERLARAAADRCCD